MEKKNNIVSAAILAAGLSLSGYFIYNGIGKYSEKDRCVTVKGLSEREVLANRVTWHIQIIIEGNNVNALLSEVTAKTDTLMAYLKENGIKEKELSVSSPYIDDRIYNKELMKKHKPRYEASVSITVNTNKVEEVVSLRKRRSELLKRGVCITSDDSYSIQFEYEDLTSLKPEMVEEATKDARAVALKFVKDAGCELGSIRDASQGLFTIDEKFYRPEYKQIRVVTNVSYYLK